MMRQLLFPTARLPVPPCAMRAPLTTSLKFTTCKFCMPICECVRCVRGVGKVARAVARRAFGKVEGFAS